jgi:hypothetical protein
VTWGQWVDAGWKVVTVACGDRHEAEESLFGAVRDRHSASVAFLEQLFATHIGGFFGWDVIISSVVLWVMVVVEGRRADLGHRWIPIAANLAVGVSLALPLFLYMREARRETDQG